MYFHILIVIVLTYLERAFLYLLIAGIVCSCSSDKPITEINLDQYYLEDSTLQLSVVAAEPDVIAPVAIDFDKKGRLWVAEMSDYMPDIDASGEQQAQGRIVILEDKDGDGFMEEGQTFMEGLSQLRAIRLFNGGLLYADNPNLWFVKIQNDQPGEKILIDSLYAYGGNVEHRPNGLLRNHDNCFYSAKSNFRYCYDNGSWKKESTSFRGQWGIARDENGRLYANDNSNLLFGDYYLPNTIINNQNISKIRGIMDDLVGERSVFPLHATAINRGYNQGVLDEEGRLKKTTAACSPYIFNAKGLGEKYARQTYICVPEANIVKRLKIEQNKLHPNAELASYEIEFLASTDEAFRPVSITVGPEGAMYIVDMHRGIIQHKTYMTNYLRKRILSRGLDTIMDYGRILRIAADDSIFPFDINWESSDELTELLKSDNDWLRSKAEETLIYAEEDLKEKLEIVLNEASKLGQISSLWVLEHRGELDLSKIYNSNALRDPWFLANCIKVLMEKSIKDLGDYKKMLEYLRSSNDEVVLNHVFSLLAPFYEMDKAFYEENLRHFVSSAGERLLPETFLSAFPSGTLINSKYIDLISSSYGEEWIKEIDAYNQFVKEGKKNWIHNPINYARMGKKDGREKYNLLCASCHGIGGNGNTKLAPSLINADLVNGHKSLVPLIIINGLQDALTVNGKMEKYSTVMPSFYESNNLTALEIADISNYIYNAFSDEVKYISAEEVNALIHRYKDRSDLWTEGELKKLLN